MADDVREAYLVNTPDQKLEVNCAVDEAIEGAHAFAPDSPSALSRHYVDEYKDVSENLRFYSARRPTTLTLYLGSMTVIANIYFSQDLSLLSLGRLADAVLGLLAVIGFWSMEDRAAKYWRKFLNRALELEHTLGYKQYRIKPTPSLISATVGTRILYGIPALLWLGLILRDVVSVFRGN